MTLNQIAERIAYSLNEPLNFVLKENIKFSVIAYRALFIRRDAVVNGLSDEFLQSYNSPLIKVDKGDNCYYELGCDVLRTENKVPKPLRLKTDVVFKFVGTPTGKPFSYSEFEEVGFRCYNKYTGNEIVYSYINGYIYIYNASKLKFVRIQQILADPRQAVLCSTSDTCYSDNSEFPMPEDFVPDIIRSIKSGEFNIMNPKDEQVKIDVEDDK